MNTNKDLTPGEYFKTIDDCAKNRKNLTISNGCAEHAAYLIKTFFKHAQEKVCIFTGEMYDGVFEDNDLCEEALVFLRKSGCNLSIILEKEIDSTLLSQKALIRAISADDSLEGSFRLSYATKDVSDINHFAVMDGEAFRYELDHLDRKAIANFGDDINGSKLQKIFEIISSFSTTIIPVPQA